MVTALDIAQICHEANRALQIALGEDNVSAHWDEVSPHLRESVYQGVVKALAGETPEQLHRSWCQFKVDHGWVYGPVKDEAVKTHPCIVAYDKLPESQRLKDYLFHSIVNSLNYEEK